MQIGENVQQRIRGIGDDEATGTAREVFEASSVLLGRTANLLRILAHSPDVAKWFLPLVAAIRQPNAGATSDARLRNMAVLKTSTINACHY